MLGFDGGIFGGFFQLFLHCPQFCFRERYVSKWVCQIGKEEQTTSGGMYVFILIYPLCFWLPMKEIYCSVPMNLLCKQIRCSLSFDF